MTKVERIEKQKQRLSEMQEYERKLRGEGFHLIAGVDEVGRGPLAGPVVAAAVVLPSDFDVLGVDDSKKLSEKKREQLYGEILERAVCWGIGRKDNTVIDEINILEATKLAMAEAIEQAEAMLKEKAGADKNIDFVLFDAMKIEAVKKPQMSLIKGDAKSISIGAASIIAKVTRDAMMVEYDKIYPEYDFASNKGYGSAKHIEALKKYGPCPIHRRSFIHNFI